MSKDRLKVKVAVFNIFKRDGHILLLLRQNTGYRDGYWTFPAGHVDSGELPSEASKREAKEETGTKVNKTTPLHIIFRRKTGEYTPYIDIYFAVETFTGEPRIPEAEKVKCAEMKWFPKNNFPNNLFPGLANALVNIEKGIPYSEITED